MPVSGSVPKYAKTVKPYHYGWCCAPHEVFIPLPMHHLNQSMLHLKPANLVQLLNSEILYKSATQRLLNAYSSARSKKTTYILSSWKFKLKHCFDHIAYCY